MRVLSFLSFASLSFVACASPPSKHPTTMEALPPPSPEEPQKQEQQQQQVQAMAPEPNAFTLRVGETLTLPASDTKEWSESGPGIVGVSSDGTSIFIAGRKPGTNVVLFICTDGTSRSVTFTVVGGERQP